MPRKYPYMAREAVRNISYDWTKFLSGRGSGVTLSSCTVESDPNNLDFGSVSLNGNVSTVTVTIPENTAPGEYKIIWTATLSNSEVEPRSVPLNVVKHKETR